MEGNVKETGIDVLFNIANYIILSLFLIAILYPLIYVLSASISQPETVMSGQMWLFPLQINFNGYAAVLKNNLIWTGFGNSLFYTVIGTLINVALTLAAAYPLSRRDYAGRNALMMLFVFTMLFSGGIIPSYLLVKDLGLLDTRWAMILPGALAVWNMIITRTYFQTTLPQELLEAAQMDGCGDLKYFMRIVLPLSPPIIAVISLFYAVGHWNEFFNALLYLKSQSRYPIQLVLRDILIQNEVNPDMLGNLADLQARQNLAEQLKFSLIVIASFPVLIVYPFVQRHFVKGVMIGSLKG